MRRNIIAGNWKMHKTHLEAREFVAQLLSEVKKIHTSYEVIVIPPFTALESVSRVLDRNYIKLGAQNVFYEEKGAYTGEISPVMLKALDVDYVVIGHSERRKYFGETDEIIAKKVRAVIDHEMMPILCIGETLEERTQGIEKEVVNRQLEKGLSLINDNEIGKIVIAYEPVWAIGTGRTATPEIAQEMHSFIRRKIKDIKGTDNLPILYGGSVKPDNIVGLSSMPDIDGALVGGASLKVDSFTGIIKNAVQGG